MVVVVQETIRIKGIRIWISIWVFAQGCQVRKHDRAFWNFVALECVVFHGTMWYSLMVTDLALCLIQCVLYVVFGGSLRIQTNLGSLWDYNDALL